MRRLTKITNPEGAAKQAETELNDLIQLKKENSTWIHTITKKNYIIEDYVQQERPFMPGWMNSLVCLRETGGANGTICNVDLRTFINHYSRHIPDTE